MTELPGQLADPGRYLRAQRELADRLVTHCVSY